MASFAQKKSTSLQRDERIGMSSNGEWRGPCMVLAVGSCECHYVYVGMYHSGIR